MTGGLVFEIFSGWLSNLAARVRYDGNCRGTVEGDHMKYIALLYGEPGAGPVPGTPEFMTMLGEFQSATQAMADAGILVDSSPLQSPQTATTVRVRDGETLLSDGPFAEIKEQLGGYYILECEDLDMALRYAAMIPSAKYGSVEVRPVMVM